MRDAGWNLDVSDDTTTLARPQLCGTSTFWGYHLNFLVGRVWATFKGFGHAKLIFGNCYGQWCKKTNCKTKAYHNYHLLREASEDQKSIKVEFLYEPGDVLYIEEENNAAISIHSLELKCESNRIIIS